MNSDDRNIAPSRAILERNEEHYKSVLRQALIGSKDVQNCGDIGKIRDYAYALKNHGRIFIKSSIEYSNWFKKVGSIAMAAEINTERLTLHEDLNTQIKLLNRVIDDLGGDLVSNIDN